MNALILALMIGQPAPVPPPPEVPPVAWPTYNEAHVESQRTGKPIVCYVGTKPYEHDWAITAYETTFTRLNGKVETKAILLAKDHWGHWLHPSMTKAEMQPLVDAMVAPVRYSAPMMAYPSVRGGNC